MQINYNQIAKCFAKCFHVSRVIISSDIKFNLLLDY